MVSLIDLTSPTVDSIYRHYETRNTDGERTYLGMSTMGTECDRALWYSFRWVSDPEKFSGRMLRLFDTGNIYEARMLGELEAIGITVWRVDPETGEQWAMQDIDGHFRGHMDGKGVGFAEAPTTEHVLEFKTHNDKSWRDVVTKGVKLAKPGHYAQVQLYMHYSGLTRAFYLAHNKNTDELYQERIEYDPIAAAQLVTRAERIIRSATPPPRLHISPNSKAAWACKFCPHMGVCHEGIPSRRNCRTCLSSTPVASGFHCDLYKQVNDPHLQKMGCSEHLLIPDLVNGQQVDADIETRTVTYTMRDGSTWIDGLV